MAEHTTFIVASDRDALILEKLATLEDGIQGLVPLLEKIVMHLEMQAPDTQKQPMATYDDLYTLAAPGPPEGELVQAVQYAQVSADDRAWWHRLLWGAPS